MQQTGPRTVAEYGLFAGAQQEGLLDQLDALAHRQPAGERPEVLGLLVEAAAVIGQTRKLARREADIGIGLVVAEEDVVLGRELLDQRVLKNQRLGFRARRRRHHIRHLLQHQRDARAVAGLLEIGADPPLEVLGLADVKHRLVGIEHAINARILGQCGEEGLGVKRGRVWLRGVRRHRMDQPRRGVQPRPIQENCEARS